MNTGLEEYIETGIDWTLNVSGELLINIFIPKHTTAMMVPSLLKNKSESTRKRTAYLPLSLE